ncbi:DNA translocase FtsK [Aerococcus sp. YH-aer221]|uniref:DNA translocase FtsK n=1 Tax=Aerococcus kribbianus TaxID=2999064 RepID=A0A9X3JDN3_9LACT|nr:MULTISPECIES: DNA translocase FtsK [unclassified Aerococcus]MCZ0717680.1 DNA translocase FtsK [Aerococcus sp. YH-aer221]MCZ0725968.1 DNA translocase FtsK [Aerococcus sp. YH-aer222]
MAKTRKKRTNKKQKQNVQWQVTAIIILFISIIGIAHLGFFGRLINHLIQLFIGDLYIAVLIVLAYGALTYLFSGHLPKIRNRLHLTVLLLLPVLALLFHAWTYQNVAASDDSIITSTWQRGVANFMPESTNITLGGGLVGALLYSLSYFALSQLGTYIIIGMALIAILCFLFGISASDLLQAFQLIGLSLADWWADFYQASKSQITQWHTKRKEARADKAAGKNNKDKASLPTQEDRQNVVETEAPTPTSNDHSEVEIVGPKPITSNQSDLVEDNHPSVSSKKGNHIVDRPESQVNPDQGNAEEDDEVLSEEELGAITMDGEHENPDYQLPSSTLLRPIRQVDQSSEYEVIKENVRKLEATFASFNVDAKVTKANLGPAVTKYEIQPAIGVKVSKIVNLADDIALALAAKDIRIEAPIPGKSFIGIEVPNQRVSLVSFRDSFENQEQTDKLLNVALGRDISGNIQSADLTKMPHLLVAGSTGSGKSVAINGMIVSILMKAKPNEVKLMMIDPKKVELNVYNGIPHLLTPVVTNPRKAAQALNKVVEEMERRYELFAMTGQRNIDGYNEHIQNAQEEGEAKAKLPYIVVIVDELADLMMVASKEVEAAIMRLAQMARAAGIHMILATQRPSVDVITGIIKANVPSRIAFAVSSGTDSRTIIDQNGAEKLLGRGDMLFTPMGEGKPIRVQGAYITDEEVEHVVEFVKNQQEANYVEAMMPSESTSTEASEDLDELWDQVLDFVKSRDTVSISMLQRQFRIGYNRSARLVDDLEAHNYVSPQDGSKPRQVLITEEDQSNHDPQ